MTIKAPQHTTIEYSTEQLLKYACNMLESARQDQIEGKRNQKWLIDNETFRVIKNAVASRSA